MIARVLSLVVLLVPLHALRLGLVMDEAHPIIPTQFAIPSLKWELYARARSKEKTGDFSPLIPRIRRTYIYKTEDEYINAYGSYSYALTFKKAGWDCLRHYEILMAGTVPYFLGLDKIPKKTMHKFPRELVREAMTLPGVPTEAEVEQSLKKHRRAPPINHTIFPLAKFNDLRKKLIEYTQNNLLAKHTNVQTGDTVAISNGHDHIVGSHGMDYQRNTVVIGLLEQGKKVITTFDISHLFDDFKGSTSRLYGHGFTMSRSIPSSLKKNWNFSSVSQINNMTDIESYIVASSGDDEFPEHNPFEGHEVMCVDGSDPTLSLPPYCTVTYQRENH
jgi:hypothetical protein